MGWTLRQYGKRCNFATCMKVVVDEKIPYIREACQRAFDEVAYLPGDAIGPEDVKDADALIVRTRTRCNRQLLEGSRVRFVATATIGYDHLDVEYLEGAGIGWTNQPGCNASSVAQYVRNSLLVLERRGQVRLRDAVVGIVGVGHVGREVVKALQPFGCRLLLNDPPREERERIGFCSLEELAERCDVVTFHVPLTHDGKWPTYHMADKAFVDTLKRRPVLINAARGEVVCTEALVEGLDEGKVRAAVIDTWENEPNASPELLERAVIATPHIAGYSADGKANASRMAMEAVCVHFGIETQIDIEPPSLPDTFVPAQDVVERHLQYYNPLTDTEAFKAHPERFEQLRNNYPLRREG